MASSPWQDAWAGSLRSFHAISEAPSKFGPTLFRDDFFTYLKQAKKPDGTAYSDDDIKKLVYLPTDAVMSPDVPATLKVVDQTLILRSGQVAFQGSAAELSGNTDLWKWF